MHFIEIRISSDGDLKNIMKNVCIKPDFVYNKGEKKVYRNEEVVYKESCWIKRIEVDNNEEFNSVMESFLLEMNFIKLKDILKQKEDINTVMWISFYPENEQMNIHLSSDNIYKIAEMGVDIDITINSLQKYYDGLI